LPATDAPMDLDSKLELNTPLPPILEQELTQIGVLARSQK